MPQRRASLALKAAEIPDGMRPPTADDATDFDIIVLSTSEMSLKESQ